VTCDLDVCRDCCALVIIPLCLISGVFAWGLRCVLSTSPRNYKSKLVLSPGIRHRDVLPGELSVLGEGSEPSCVGGSISIHQIFRLKMCWWQCWERALTGGWAGTAAAGVTRSWSSELVSARFICRMGPLLPALPCWGGWRHCPPAAGTGAGRGCGKWAREP